MLLKLVDHGLFINGVVCAKNVSNAVLSILYIIASLWVENIRQIKELLLVDSIARLKLFHIAVEELCK